MAKGRALTFWADLNRQGGALNRLFLTIYEQQVAPLNLNHLIKFYTFWEASYVRVAGDTSVAGLTALSCAR